MAQKKEWTNDLTTLPEAAATVPEQMDREMQRLSPREAHISALAEKNKDVQPELVDITSKNPHALRVIHDFYGEAVSIPPNETAKGIPLHPNAIAYLKGPKSDLVVVPAAA